MNVWRYQAYAEIEIDAPIERVYAVASNPDIVPAYAPEVIRIEIVKRLSEHRVVVRSHLKVAGLTLAYLYRYHYRAPEHYSGVQEHGKFLRGYFNLSFKAQANRTTVSHTEGISSAIPWLAWIVGFIYFDVIARGGIVDELSRLKQLIENSSH